MQRKLTWEYITLMPWLPRSRGRWEPDVDVHRAREHRAAKPDISGLGACLQRLAQHAGEDRLEVVAVLHLGGG